MTTRSTPWEAMKRSASPMSSRRSATITISATSIPRSRRRSDSHGPLRSEMIPDSTSVPVMRMPARRLTCRSAAAPRAARAGACRGAARSRPAWSGRGRRSCGRPTRSRAWPLPKETRKRGRGSACCARRPAGRWLSISARPLASTRQTLTVPVGTICRVTRRGAAASSSCARLRARGRRGRVLDRVRRVAAARSRPRPTCRARRARPAAPTSTTTTTRPGPSTARRRRSRRGARPPARGANGVSSIVEGRSKRCLYSSTSSRESSPR